MSATTTGAVAQSKNDIPWNKHVRQKKTPGDLAVDFVIVLLLVFTVVAVLYPLWFVVIASFSDPNAVAGGEVTLLPKGVTFVGGMRRCSPTIASGRAISTRSSTRWSAPRSTWP